MIEITLLPARFIAAAVGYALPFPRRPRSPPPCVALNLRRLAQRPDDVENAVPVSSELSRLVVLPIDCTTMLTVPCSGSDFSMVSGMRSPFHKSVG